MSATEPPFNALSEREIEREALAVVSMAWSSARRLRCSIAPGR